ncbi:hypothetical protein GQ600_20614 [Phytophthora cactorum]|nr:hypothetical protein GQ600_20614 [Phytophthora cactorum]
MTGYSELKQAMREQLVVNAGVMIRKHFRKRLRAYMRDVLTPDGEEWSEKWIPWPDNIKKNGMEFYIRLIWNSRARGGSMEAVPNEKGPPSKSCDDCHATSICIDRFETRKRSSCSYQSKRSTNTPAILCQEIKLTGTAHQFSTTDKHEELGGEDDSLVPEGYSPDVVIGLDPGMRSLCTAAREYLRLQAPRQRSRRKVRRPRRKNRKKGRSKRNCGENAISQSGYAVQSVRAIATTENRSVTTASTGIWPGSTLPRLERESEEEVPGLQEVIEGMPSFKTSSYRRPEAADYFWQHAVPDSGLPQGRPETQEEEDEGKSPPSRLVAAEIKSKHCHVVLRCENENCEARYWDRDVNAAINMLELLKSEVQGRGRRGQSGGLMQSTAE